MSRMRPLLGWPLCFVLVLAMWLGIGAATDGLQRGEVATGLNNAALITLICWAVGLDVPRRRRGAAIAALSLAIGAWVVGVDMIFGGSFAGALFLAAGCVVIVGVGLFFGWRADDRRRERERHGGQGAPAKPPTVTDLDAAAAPFRRTGGQA